MKKVKRFAFPIIVLITVFVIIYVFNFVSKPQIVGSDEGDYIWTGNIITNTIRARNWRLFWQLTYPQFHYPFIQSWYLGLVTLPFEYEVESVRLVSLFLLLPTVILIWLIARKMSQRLSVSAIACGLILTSPLTLFYFSHVLKEGLATFLSYLTIWLYFLSREKKSLLAAFLVSILCLTLTLTKYNYGALVLLALGLESLIWLTKDKGYQKQNYWLTNIFLYLPFLLGFTIWLFYPVNRFGYLFPFPQSKDVFNLYQTTLIGHLLYYPMELAFSYCFSWLAFLLLAIGFLWALKDWRNYQIRVLVSFFLINFILAERHIINNQGRYIFTSVPAFFLVASFGLVQARLFIRKTVKKIERNSLVLGLIIPFVIWGIIILIKDFLIFPQIITRTGSHQTQSAVFYEQDYQNISSFNFDRNSWPRIPPPPGSEKLSDLMAFVLENVDLNKNIYLVGSLNEFNRGIFDFYLDKARQKNLTSFPSKYQEYFVVLQVKDGSRFDNFDYRVFGRLRAADSAQKTLADKSLTRLKQKVFPYLGLTVTILSK